MGNKVVIVFDEGDMEDQINDLLRNNLISEDDLTNLENLVYSLSEFKQLFSDPVKAKLHTLEGVFSWFENEIAKEI